MVPALTCAIRIRVLLSVMQRLASISLPARTSCSLLVRLSTHRQNSMRHTPTFKPSTKPCLVYQKTVKTYRETVKTYQIRLKTYHSLPMSSCNSTPIVPSMKPHRATVSLFRKSKPSSCSSTTNRCWSRNNSARKRRQTDSLPHWSVYPSTRKPVNLCLRRQTARQPLMLSTRLLEAMMKILLPS